MRVGRIIYRCQAPYFKRLSRGRSKEEASLFMLWNHATLLETYQGYVQPVGPQLATLAGSWGQLSLRNRPMRTFVRALAAEFEATLDAAPFDSCSFVKAIAAHHFSYGWAKRSSYGLQAARWWRVFPSASDRTAAFWST